MPAKGACGATTIACNLAFQWKRHGQQKVLLADLDPLTGTISFLLKIKSIYSFLDALQRAHELDADLWNAMVTNVNGVDVLLAPELMVEGAQDLRDPSPILEYARHDYDVVVIDAGGVYGEWNLNTARLANELLLVTTNELPALQAAQRALSYLDTNRIGRWKIRLMVNRYHRDVGLSREVIGTALHTEVFDILPSDYEAVQKSLMEGKPAPSNTTFGKSHDATGRPARRTDGAGEENHLARRIARSVRQNQVELARNLRGSACIRGSDSAPLLAHQNRIGGIFRRILEARHSDQPLRLRRQALAQGSDVLRRGVLNSADRVGIIQRVAGGFGDQRVAQAPLPVHRQPALLLALFGSPAPRAKP